MDTIGTLQSEQEPPAGWRRWLVLAALLALVFAVSFAGSLFTAPQIGGWYASLNKPRFNPPPWVFGPVWKLLYVLMAVAAWRVWMLPASSLRTAALGRFFLQLFLNAIWSPVFFGMQSPRAALAVIGVLVVMLAATVAAFFRLDRPAGWMLVPYLAWVCFASVLNGAIVALN